MRSPDFTCLFIPDEDLAEMPPTDIFICENDILKNDGQILAARLSFLNKKHTLVCMDGALHANLVFSEQFGFFKNFRKTNEYCENYFRSLSAHC